jgi:arylsulfatase
MSKTKRPSKIILIVLDTLRTDHLGCYGYKRNTTPNIDHLTKDSILFNHAFSPSSYTMPSHASMFTGKLPSKHSTGFSNGHPVLPLDNDLFLTEILSDLSYETVGFVSSIVLSKNNGGGIKPGFKVYDDTMTGAELNRPEILIRMGKETNEAVFKWLAENFMKDFFLFINYFDIHGPYVNPEPYDSMFVGDGFCGKPNYLDKVVPDSYAVGGIPEYQVLRPSRDEKERLIDFEKDANYYIARYDGGIRYVDDCVGELIDKLKRLGIYDDTLIILTSDHGEALGENNVWFFHGLTVTPDQIHVPLMIKPHGNWQNIPFNVNNQVSLIDIMPTLLDLIGFDHKRIELEGLSLIKILMQGEDAEFEKRELTAEIEGQIAYIDKDSIKIRQRIFDKGKSVFCHIEELCKKEMTIYYKDGKEGVFEYGKCFICGNHVDFQIEKGFSLREARCPICLGTKRSRDLAKTILKTYLKDETLSLAEGLDHLKDLMIYEAQASGPIHDYLCKLPKYICSEYFDDIPLGSMNNSGIRCEDLERLTFPDNSFDLVITQDVFEHIMNPERAFKEIYRVLKPGGCHIFTIPFHEGRKTVRRVKREEGKNVFILPPVYHIDPLRESGSLVYTDFGEDIIDDLNSLGIPTEIVLQERFYSSEMIPWINDESSHKIYKNSREKGEMLKYFLYNSVVLKSVKKGKPDMLTMDRERFLPWMEDAAINYEHLHRYRFAKEFVKGKKVLDLACGEGYGSFMLSEDADSVLGIDIDDLSVRHASSKYIKEHLEFIKGSITDIPIESEKIFDVIVCFEALEHIEEHDELMNEVKRLLKDDGIFIVSTPNKSIYSDQPNFQNLFHLKELYFDEFKALLNRNFKNTIIYGQKVYPSSNIFPVFRGSATTKDYVIEKGDRAFLFVQSERKEARYFIAVSSNSPLKEEAINSHLLDISEALFKQQDGRIANLETAINEKEVCISSLQGTLRERETHIVNLERQREENYRDWQARVGNLEKTLQDKERYIQNLEQVLKDKMLHIENLEAIRKDRETHIGNLEAVIKQKEATLNRIYNSCGLGALLVCNKMIDLIFPINSRRRLLAKIILNAFKTRKSC